MGILCCCELNNSQKCFPCCGVQYKNGEKVSVKN
jgi:hypothetical protein